MFYMRIRTYEKRNSGNQLLHARAMMQNAAKLVMPIFG